MEVRVTGGKDRKNNIQLFQKSQKPENRDLSAVEEQEVLLGVVEADV